MALLPQGHDYHVEQAVVQRALDLLGRVQGVTTASAPKVLREDEETVLFTWQRGNVKTYLCIDDQDVTAMVRGNLDSVIRDVDISADNAADLNKLAAVLGVGMRTETID